MIELFLFVWAWLCTAATIEAQAVQLIAKSSPPSKREACCNYIMKEADSETGDICEESVEG